MLRLNGFSDSACSLGRPPGPGIADQRPGLPSPTATMSHHVPWWQAVAGDAMPDTVEPWVTSEEICAYLRISANTLTRWLAVRGMPGHRIGRSLRFRLSEVDAWIKAGSPSRKGRKRS